MLEDRPGLRAGGGPDVDVFAVPLGAEFDRTLDQGEERVILAHADTGARIKLRATLADQNIAGQNVLAAKALDAQALSVGIAPVARGTGAFFGCEELEIKREHSRASIAKPAGHWQASGPASPRAATLARQHPKAPG